MPINRHQPRTATLWTLAMFIIIADQLSKAWFVFRLGNLHHIQTFGEFLPQYFSEFNRSPNPKFSLLKAEYYSEFGANSISVVGDWVRFYLTTNKGAAWSMFNNQSLILSGVSLLIAALLWWVWKRNFVYHRGMTIAIGAIIGGALGNFIDRFRLQEVVDFVAVNIPYIGKWFPALGSDPYHFPIFNVADACAVCGTLALAGYLLWLDLTAGKRKRKQQEELNRAFKPYEPLDEEAIERARHVDTSAVPVWNETMNMREEEQEQISRERANKLIEAEVATQLPELTDDYQPTASALEVARQETQVPPVHGGEVTSVDNDDEDEDVVV